VLDKALINFGRLSIHRCLLPAQRDSKGRFVKGHTTNIGRPCDEKTKRKISESMMGRAPTSGSYQIGNQRWKLRTRTGMRGGQTNSGSFKKGSIPWNRGRKPTNKELEQLKARGFQVGSVPWNTGLTKHDHPSLMRMSEIMKVKRYNQIIPVKDTSIEILIQNELNRRDITFEKHICVCGRSQPDIVFREQKIAVFCDGDYWHSLPDKKKQDIRQNKLLSDNGWIVLRFTGTEIRKNIKRCVDVIEAALPGVI